MLCARGQAHPGSETGRSSGKISASISACITNLGLAAGAFQLSPTQQERGPNDGHL